MKIWKTAEYLKLTALDWRSAKVIECLNKFFSTGSEKHDVQPFWTELLEEIN